ncbi:MAG TPA: HEPN domain-containing protein, partial [Blastocatellia bacterium]
EVLKVLLRDCMNRNDLKGLTRIRLQEAKSLMASGHYAGAYYLAGYVVECALKACIAKETRRHDFPDKNKVNASWTHQLTRLVDTAGLSASLDAEGSSDPKFAWCWGVVKEWTEESRYTIVQEKKAGDLLTAISDRNHGVLMWLRRYW